MRLDQTQKKKKNPGKVDMTYFYLVFLKIIQWKETNIYSYHRWKLSWNKTKSQHSHINKGQLSTWENWHRMVNSGTYFNKLLEKEKKLQGLQE